MKNSDKQWKKNQPYLWYAILFFALFGTLGSLYYSNFGEPIANMLAGTLFPSGQGLPPCTLCWWARILLYPMVVISAVGIRKKDQSFTDYILPLSLAGIGLTTYNYAIQKFGVKQVLECATDVVPCSEVQVEYFGFVTIPLLGLIAFIGVTVLCVLNKEVEKLT
jgi:disulfide bond formation protein DsbB